MAKAKAAPAPKTAAPKKTAAADKSSKPKMTKTAFMQELVDGANKALPDAQLTKKQVEAMYAAMIDIVKKELSSKGPGEVTLPNICKLSAVHSKADKGGKKIANPFKPGETMVTKPKPARTKIKVRGLKNFLETIAPPSKK